MSSPGQSVCAERGWVCEVHGHAAHLAKTTGTRCVCGRLGPTTQSSHTHIPKRARDEDGAGGLGGSRVGLRADVGRAPRAQDPRLDHCLHSWEDTTAWLGPWDNHEPGHSSWQPGSPCRPRLRTPGERPCPMMQCFPTMTHTCQLAVPMSLQLPQDQDRQAHGDLWSLSA